MSARPATLDPLSHELADRIVGIVEEFGLRPEPIPKERPEPITEADLGVVCFQVVLARS